jgi:hypothetical protein
MTGEGAWLLGVETDIASTPGGNPVIGFRRPRCWRQRATASAVTVPRSVSDSAAGLDSVLLCQLGGLQDPFVVVEPLDLFNEGSTGNLSPIDFRVLS